MRQRLLRTCSEFFEWWNSTFAEGWKQKWPSQFYHCYCPIKWHDSYSDEDFNLLLLSSEIRSLKDCCYLASLLCPYYVPVVWVLIFCYRARIWTQFFTFHVIIIICLLANDMSHFWCSAAVDISFVNINHGIYWKNVI